MSLGAAVSLAVPVWGQGGRGAAGLWFLSEPGPAHCFVPLLGSGFGDSSVSPAGPAELAQLWAEVQDGDVPAPGLGSVQGCPCSSPSLALVDSPIPLLPSEAGRGFLCQALQEIQEQWGSTDSRAAEPFLVPSGSQFLTPGFGGAAPPVLHIQLCSFPALGLAPQTALGRFGLSLCPSACRDSAAPAQAVGQTVQCLPAGEGRFVLFLALCHVYPQFIFTPGCRDGMSLEQSWLLPLACSSQAAPAPSQPPTAVGTLCCVLLCSFGSILHPFPMVSLN